MLPLVGADEALGCSRGLVGGSTPLIFPSPTAPGCCYLRWRRAPIERVHTAPHAFAPALSPPGLSSDARAPGSTAGASRSCPTAGSSRSYPTRMPYAHSPGHFPYTRECPTLMSQGPLLMLVRGCLSAQAVSPCVGTLFGLFTAFSVRQFEPSLSLPVWLHLSYLMYPGGRGARSPTSSRSHWHSESNARPPATPWPINERKDWVTKNETSFNPGPLLVTAGAVETIMVFVESKLHHTNNWKVST